MDSDDVDDQYCLPLKSPGGSASPNEGSHNTKEGNQCLDDNLKKKKAKKEKKRKKDEKKKKKKKKSEQKLQDGKLENQLDLDFDAFVSAKASRLFNEIDAQQYEDGTQNVESTPITVGTSTASMPIAGLENPFRSDNSSEKDGQDVISINSDSFKDFLKSQGQDEKLALATAQAFESFLRHQDMYSTTTSHRSSVTSDTSYNSNAESSKESTSQGLSSNDAEEESSEEECDDVEDEDCEYVHDFSDVSTLGWSAADDFSNSWTNGTFVSRFQSEPIREETGETMDAFGEVRRNESYIAPTRKLPNLVAATQAKLNVSTTVSRIDVAKERSFEEQMASLSIDERKVVSALKAAWLKSGRPPFSNFWYLKFARCSPGRPFSYKAALKNMKHFDQRYLSLSIITMEKQIRTKTLFPVPGLKTCDGHLMFYMKPARYVPKMMSVSSVINNLVYVMDCMMEIEVCQKDGIGFIANMTDWKMSNFQVSYCYKFMMGLQGYKTPTRVKMFLIVNPPNWFGSIWKIMKPMLGEEFRKKVHMIKFDQMSEYLSQGFEEYLPDDIFSGKQNTDKIINDFVAERKRNEIGRQFSDAVNYYA